MDFDFTAEQKQLKETARRFLTDKCSSKAVRVILDGPEPYDKALWKELASMGFLGTAIPEEYGGLGLGYLELCVIAEELGRVVAPVPLNDAVTEGIRRIEDVATGRVAGLTEEQYRAALG